MKKLTKYNISIGFKLISIISLIIITAVVAMIIVVTVYFTRDKERSIQENNLKLSEVIAQKVRDDFRAVREKSEAFAAEGAEDLFFRKNDDCIAVARLTMHRGTPAVRLDAVNPGFGGAGGLTPAAIRGFLREEMGIWRHSLQGETLVRNVSAGFRAPVIGVGFPAGQGEALVAFVRMRRFLDAVKSYDIYKSFIVNGAGEVIAHHDESVARAGVNLANLEIVRRMRASAIDNGQLSYADRGVDYLGAFQRIDFGGIAVVTCADRRVALAAVRQIFIINALVAVIILTAAILCIYWFSKTLTNPIGRLVEATSRIMAGEFNVAIQPSTSDEVGTLTASFITMGRGLAEREKMKDAFGRFVNKEIAELVLRDEIKLGGERKNAAILFSDIRAFTTLSENLQPEEVVEFLNEYLTKMVACVNAAHGVVDKFIGDAIMAVFGTPVSRGNDTENAINCGLLMRKVLYHFNRARAEEGKPAIRIGIGINTGDVLAGQIGSHDRMEYTVIGDAVNLASRLEGLNKAFGTDILVSEDSWRLVPGIFDAVPLQRIRIKGKAEPQQIYAVLGRLDNPKRIASIATLQRLLGIDRHGLRSAAEVLNEKKYEIIG